MVRRIGIILCPREAWFSRPQQTGQDTAHSHNSPAVLFITGVGGNNWHSKILLKQIFGDNYSGGKVLIASLRILEVTESEYVVMLHCLAL